MADGFKAFAGKEITNTTTPNTSNIPKAMDHSIESSRNIVQELLPANQYVGEHTSKNAIVLHHTAGGSADSSIAWWKQSSDRVGTHFIIDRDGTVKQVVPLTDWIYHLYVASKGNKIPARFKRIGSTYDKHTIGIELASYGPLTQKDGKFYNVYNKEVLAVEKLDKGHKGYIYYEAYTPAQIKSLKVLLESLMNVFGIPRQDHIEKIFDINDDALQQRPGIYTHVSYRTDKFDCYPSKALIEMLKSL